MMAVLLSACSGPKAARSSSLPRDAYYQRVTTSAHAAFHRGDIERATVLFEQAYQRAHLMDRAGSIADSAYHLAVCHVARGDRASALPLLQEARLEWQFAGQSAMPALLAQAEAERLAGQGEAAWTITTEALTLARNRDERTQLHGLRALLALEAEDQNLAADEWAAAQRAASRSAPSRLQARLAEVEGRMALIDAQPLIAAAAFEREATHYARAGRYGDMARANLRAADAYAEGGVGDKAVDLYYRAARHLVAAEDHLAALKAVQTALPMVSALESDEWAGRMAQLVDQVGEAVKKSAP
jgi:hypothetical protein